MTAPLPSSPESAELLALADELHSQALGSRAKAVAMLRHIAAGLAQCSQEPHERTYLRGWNEGIERAAEVCEVHQWTRHATNHSPTKSCAIAIRSLADTSTVGKLGCRRCGGWGTIRLGNMDRQTCELCLGTGRDPGTSDSSPVGDNK